MFNSCSKYTGGTACHSDFIMLQAAKGKHTDTSLSLGFSSSLSLPNLISQDIKCRLLCVKECPVLNESQMKPNIQQWSGSLCPGSHRECPGELVFDIQRRTDFSVCQRGSFGTPQWSNWQIIVSVVFVNEILLTRGLRNTYCQLQPNCPAGASTHSKLSLNSLKPSQEN